MDASRIDELADDIRNAFGHTPGCECAACTELLGLLNTYLAPEGDWEGLSEDEKNAFFRRALYRADLTEFNRPHEPEDESRDTSEHVTGFEPIGQTRADKLEEMSRMLDAEFDRRVENWRSGGGFCQLREPARENKSEELEGPEGGSAAPRQLQLLRTCFEQAVLWQDDSTGSVPDDPWVLEVVELLESNGECIREPARKLLQRNAGDILIGPGERYTSAWMKLSDPRRE